MVGGEGSENELPIQERFASRMEENNSLGKLAVKRSEETIKRLKSIDNIEHLQLAAEYGKAREAGERFTNDSQWVYSLREVGVSKDIILRAWDIKDEKNRKLNEQTRDLLDQK